MAPNKGASASKAAAKAQKKLKQTEKAAKKEAAALKAATVKSKGKGKADAAQDDEEDLDAILERYRQEMEAVSSQVTTTLEAPPPPRTNALLMASPSTLASEAASNHLYLLFGEYFDGSRATFYNSTLRYDIAKDEWREYKSGHGPAPRSSAAGVGVPGLGEGGGILIFGGEYASPTQTTFHHYKDMWLFSIKTHLWEKMEFRKGPSGRSGHRMVLWKQYVILFGGFIDVGIKTNYLGDLWVFDLDEFKWKQIENLDKDRCPGPRSGFSFIPCPEGAILHGGYRKEYVKGTRPKGVALEDTWLLRMDTDPSKLKWEKRKKIGYHPTPRSGCSMTHWAAKGMGVMFGGVFDEERDEESMESVFYDDMFAYNTAGNGRWVSLNLKRRKKAGKRRAKKETAIQIDDDMSPDEDNEDESKDGIIGNDDEMAGEEQLGVEEHTSEETMDDDPDDPLKTTPLTRYNAMITIVKNTLFIYGGIFETSNPAREYTLDDFVTLNLEKLDRFVHLRGTGLDELEWKGSDDEGDDGSDSEDEEGDEDEESEDGESEVEDDLEALEEGQESEEAKERRHAALTQAEKDVLRKSANQFLGISKDASRTEEDVLSTPLPEENLRAFYERSREYWAGTAYNRTGSRGKALRREGFELANQKYEAYKPILEEIERIQKEAELDKEAIGASKRTGMGVGEGRNRR